MSLRALTVAAAVAALPAVAAENPITLVYINGIQNTLVAAQSTVARITAVVDASANHSAAKKKFQVELVWNPIGWDGDENGPDLEEDLMELFLLKTAEEKFGADFAKVIVRFDQTALPDQDAAARVAAHLDFMLPGSNSLESTGAIHGRDMDAAQRAARALAQRMRASCRPTIVVAHSQGNLLANLAYAKVASENPRDVRMVRVINVANTSEFSVNGLDFTHRADAALRFGVIESDIVDDQSLERLPIRKGWTRTTPRCTAGPRCFFTLADAPFDPPSSEIPRTGILFDVDIRLVHSITDTYLSTATVPLHTQNGVSFTPGKDRFVDRFEDFVYAAANSFAPEVKAPPASAMSGRYVAFVSWATNLVPGDTNGVADVFVSDRTNGAIARVSIGSSGAQGNAHATFRAFVDDSRDSKPSISADGQVIAFVSNATNLVDGDRNGVADVFVRDRATGKTDRISVTTGGVEGDNHSFAPALSADGQVVTFLSQASNLVPGDTNKRIDAFVHDRRTGGTTRVSVSSAGVQGTAEAEAPSISADGCKIAFGSPSSLVPGIFGGQAFVYDRVSKTTTIASLTADGKPAIGDSLRPVISADGNAVAFLSHSSELVSGDTNGQPDHFVRDLAAGKTRRVNVHSNGSQGDAEEATTPAISADGRFVAFRAFSTTLTDGDTNGSADVFVHDTRSLVTQNLSGHNADGTQNRLGSHPSVSISSDARYVAFASANHKLVSDDKNGDDVFIRDRTTGVTQRVSVAADGTEGDGYSCYAVLNP